MERLMPPFPSPLSRRTVLHGALSFGLAVAAGRRAQAAEAGPGPLRYATLKGGDDLILRTAKVLDTPYPVEFAEFVSGNLIIEAINAQAVDLGMVADVAPILALQSDARVRFVASVKVDMIGNVVLVPKDSPISTPAELKGKRIGFVRATTSHYFLLKLLERHGLSLADVTPVNLSPADGRAAFLHGDLDAWAIFYPFANLVAAASGARTLVNAVGYLPGQYVLAASSSALERPGKSAQLGDFLRRQQRAYRWVDQNRADWATAIADTLRLPIEIVSQEINRLKVPFSLGPVDETAVSAMQDTADTFARAGLIRPLDVRPFWDHRFDAALSPA